VAATIGGAAILVAALAPFQHKVGLLNEGLLFLLLTLLISSTWGWLVGLFAAVLANLALNFFFVPPLHSHLRRGEGGPGARHVQPVDRLEARLAPHGDASHAESLP
jgi:hypothetical protein